MPESTRRASLSDRTNDTLFDACGERSTSRSLAEHDNLSTTSNSAGKEKKDSGAFVTYWRIFSYATSLEWTLMFISILGAIVSGTATALMELVFGDFVNVLNSFVQGNSSPAEFRDAASDRAVRFIYIFLARFFGSYVHTSLLNISGSRITGKIRRRFLEATLSQEIAYFDNKENGSISVQTTTNGNLIQLGTSERLGLTIEACATFVAAFIVAFISQWKLTLITLSIVPVILTVVIVTVGLDAAIENRVLGIYAQAGILAEDVISSIRNVQAFWMRPKLLKKYDTYLKKAYREGLKKNPVYGVLFSVEYFMVFVGFALAFWRGVHMYADGELPGPGDILVVIFSVMIATSSLTEITPFFSSFAIATSAAAELFRTIDRPSRLNSLQPSGHKPDNIVGHINFTCVDFNYPTRPDVKVLSQFSLDFPAKKTTALVGPSGSGKSTIIGLLERWYDPDSGSITLDGQPIDSLNVNWLRTKIRLVQQEPILFSGTVFDNVNYGLIGTEWEHEPREARMARVIEACKIANADGFISELPQGYDTQVGERAALLSGGQKQRITIARAVISDPRILLLDEATSALDPHAEGIVQQALDRASINRTTIVIAHKLATIKTADNIAVISNGKVIEQGSHEGLLEQDGAYARLVNAQSLEVPPSKIHNDSDTDDESEGYPGYEENSIGKVISPQISAKEQSRIKEQQTRLDYHSHIRRSSLGVVLSIIREQRSLWGWFVLVVIACLAGGAVQPIESVLLAKIMDVFTPDRQNAIHKGNFYSLMFFVMALGNLCSYFFLGYCCNVISQRMTYFYRRVMFEAILRQDVQFFDSPDNTVGALTSRLSTQPTQLQELMGMNLALIIIVLVNIILSSILAIVFGWKLALTVIAGGLIPLVLAGYIRMRIESNLSDEISKRFADSAALASEAVRAIRTVSSLTLERHMLNTYNDEINSTVLSSIPSILTSALLLAWTRSVENLVLSLGFWYGCRLVSLGEYSQDQFFIVFVGVFLSGQAAGQFFAYTTRITNATTAGKFISWLRTLKPVVAETDENRNRDSGPDLGDYTLNNLRFAYPFRPDTVVLKDISMHIKAGSFIALVGGSGCGKSTMVAMFERFYDPISGSLYLGESNISSLNPRLYRKKIALVQQEPTLYQGTIRENIELGLEDAEDISDDLILDACKHANIYDFVASLPDGLHTNCGTGGLSLSGGQRQRIAIARALIRNPRILLLDEATSALDTESEKLVQDALAGARKTEMRTTIAVAHRLNTIKNADRIFVFLGGRIAESGSHAELIQNRGLYWNMCKAQSLDRQVS